MSLTSFVLKTMSKKGGDVKTELESVTLRPGEEQRKLLAFFLDRAKDTEVGKRFDFASIKTAEEYQDRVPFTEYDFYSDYINRMMDGEENVLTPLHINHYNVTSGTLGVPKKIPASEEHIRLFSKYHAKYMNYLASEQYGYGWTKGKSLSLTEGRYSVLPSGASVGSASSVAAARMGKMIPGLNIDFFGQMNSSPAEARQPVPGTPTRYLHARFALAEKNITYGNTTFSSYLLEIMRYIEDNWKSLVYDIRTGTIPDGLEMPEEVRTSLKKKLKPMPKRADELEAIFSKGFDTPVMPLIWPKMQYILCVGGAGFAPYTEKLRNRYMGDKIHFLFLGLTASEGLFSVPFEMENTSSVFVPNGVFMEFIPVEKEDARPLLLDELEVGGKYELVVTNLSGLYRYRMKDTVLITGMHNNTPTMEFLNRAGYAVNMFGEKTSERALQETAVKSTSDLGLDLYDYALYPDADAVPGKYVLCLELRNYDGSVAPETIRKKAEEILSSANPSIGKKIETGVCGPLDLKLLQPETFLLYRDMQIMKGRAAAQLKPVHVLGTPYLHKFFFTFELSNEE